jgi:hypothetical protein
MAIRYIIVDIWYIFPTLACCTKINLATPHLADQNPFFWMIASMEALWLRADFKIQFSVVQRKIRMLVYNLCG